MSNVAQRRCPAPDTLIRHRPSPRMLAAAELVRLHRYGKQYSASNAPVVMVLSMLPPWLLATRSFTGLMICRHAADDADL